MSGFRPRLDEESMDHVEWAACLCGGDRRAAHRVLLEVGARVLRAAIDNGANLVHTGPGEALAVHTGPETWSTRDQNRQAVHTGPAAVHTGPAEPVAQQAPGPSGTGTPVALSSLSLSFGREERELVHTGPADWSWWDWRGDDDRLLARFDAALDAGHSAGCCLTSPFLAESAPDICRTHLRTQQPLTVAQQSGMRSAVRAVVRCEQQRRCEAGKAERQAKAREQEQAARQVTAPQWWLDQQEQAAQRVERVQRASGQRRRQPEVSGDVAAHLPNKDAGTAGKE